MTKELELPCSHLLDQTGLVCHFVDMVIRNPIKPFNSKQNTVA